MVQSTPEIVSFTLDFDESFVQVPLPLRTLPHRLRTPFPDSVSEAGGDPVHPEPDAFMADIDPTLMQEVFDIAQRQRASDIHHHAKLDNLGRGFEVPERVLSHLLRLTAMPGRLKAGSPDNAAFSAHRMTSQHCEPGYTRTKDLKLRSLECPP